MSYNDDMVVEYWFDLDYNRLVLSMNSVIKLMKSNPYVLKVVNFTIVKEKRETYTLVIVTSREEYTLDAFLTHFSRSLGSKAPRKRK